MSDRTLRPLPAHLAARPQHSLARAARPRIGWAAATLALAGAWLLATPASAQTLQEALARAYSNNPTLLAARAQLRAVDENVPQALAGWRPTVVLSGSVGTAQTRVDQQGRSTTVERSPTALTATVTQPLYRGGRTVAQTRQAENGVLAQRARLLATEQQVLGEAVNAYISVIQQAELVRLNINNEQVLSRQLQATNERFRVGEITRTDVAQAESRLAGARTSRTQAEGNLQVARATFQRVVGEAPGRLVNPQPLRVPVTSATEAQALAATNNPTVVAALFAAAGARDNIDVQMSTLLPTLSASAQAFRQENQQTAGNTTTGGQATLNLSVPIFQGGAEHALVRQARQTAQQSLQQVDEARRLVAQQAASNWESLRSARSTVESVRSQIRAAEIALDGVQREAIVGSRTTLDVLNAEQELLNARTNLVNALATVINASYALAGSIGRLTAQDLGLPVEQYDMTAYYNAVRNRWVGLGDYSIPAAARR
ncbi:TolC family outer membrane protein [Roseococcus suduntuyensis]|uniref:Outer membrane protein n=1 Tax=Roseococcus suduntuyensis TaxID=455361 RepID=A0A840ACW3_9PROT|nr:TolC family outer membrane protein [Roseococcus suduntuyensis]MBB3898180.1 outer membrane protein [Roseococcus suduntuyensis]